MCAACYDVLFVSSVFPYAQQVQAITTTPLELMALLGGLLDATGPSRKHNAILRMGTHVPHQHAKADTKQQRH